MENVTNKACLAHSGVLQAMVAFCMGRSLVLQCIIGGFLPIDCCQCVVVTDHKRFVSIVVLAGVGALTPDLYHWEHCLWSKTLMRNKL